MFINQVRSISGFVYAIQANQASGLRARQVQYVSGRSAPDRRAGGQAAHPPPTTAATGTGTTTRSSSSRSSNSNRGCGLNCKQLPLEPWDIFPLTRPRAIEPYPWEPQLLDALNIYSVLCVRYNEGGTTATARGVVASRGVRTTDKIILHVLSLLWPEPALKAWQASVAPNLQLATYMCSYCRVRRVLSTCRAHVALVVATGWCLGVARGGWLCVFVRSIKARHLLCRGTVEICHALRKEQN